MVLARLPVPVALLQRLGVFRNTRMDADLPRRLIEGLRHHWQHFERRCGRPPETYLEIGIGDTLGRALVARALGAGESRFIDARDFATEDARHYRLIDASLPVWGLEPVLAGGPSDRPAVLAASRASYDTRGLQGLAAIAGASIDLCVTEAVLEHLPRAEFAAFVAEIARVLKPDGLSLHMIDFLDHLGGNLNHLRFSPARWEGRLFAGSGFYTNRLSFSQVIAAFEAGGLACEVISRERWSAPPQGAAARHPALGWSDDDTLVASAYFAARPADAAAG